MNRTVESLRLENQRIDRTGLQGVAQVVSWLGAMQAQEFAPARWALGLRLHDGVTDAHIARAFDAGQILRTHVMRPTWHFVTPADIRWILELTAPRVQRSLSGFNRRLELDDRTLVRGIGVIERSLGDRQFLTRKELGDRLDAAGLPMTGHRLAQMVMHAELERVICSGPRRDKQFTYALLAERAPDADRLSRDEALAELGRRFFRSHGPATVRDFMWWSSLGSADGRRAVDMIKARREEIDGMHYWSVRTRAGGAMRAHLVHLLPIYDEYIVAYRDRRSVPHTSPAIVADARGAITFRHALIIRGQVAGTWRTVDGPKGVMVHVYPLRPLRVIERRELAAAIRRYARFLARDVETVVYRSTYRPNST